MAIELSVVEIDFGSRENFLLEIPHFSPPIPLVWRQFIPRMTFLPVVNMGVEFWQPVTPPQSDNASIQ
jgi:hypothetical protein